MEHYASLAIRSMFLENMALAFFLGMCSFLACSKKVETALGLGVAVVFVQVLTVPLNNLILRHLLAEGALDWVSPALASVNLSFLSFILFIGTIAAATQVVEMAVDRFAPRLYATLGVFLPLIAVNCVILAGPSSCRSATTPSARVSCSGSARDSAGRSRSSRWPRSARSSPIRTFPQGCAGSASRS